MSLFSPLRANERQLRFRVQTFKIDAIQQFKVLAAPETEVRSPAMTVLFQCKQVMGTDLGGSEVLFPAFGVTLSVAVSSLVEGTLYRVTYRPTG